MTKAEILTYLDHCEFPMLDNGYYYHIAQKMTIFKDEQANWAILLEILAYNNHELDVKGIKTMVYTYGNQIPPEAVWGNDPFFAKATDHEVPAFLEETDRFRSFLNLEAEFFSVGDTLIPIERDPGKYTAKGIELQFSPRIQPWEVMRYIAPEFAHLFWVNRSEIADKIPPEMKAVATLYDWEHPDLVVGENPSDKASFSLIADFILSGDEKILDQIQNGNTHWRNWQNGGTL